MWKYFVNKLRSFIGAAQFELDKMQDNLAKSLDSTTPLIFFAGEKCNESYAF